MYRNSCVFSQITTAVVAELPYCVLEVVVRSHTLQVPTVPVGLFFTCGRCWSQQRCMGFQTARFQTATLLLSVPNVFAQPVSIGKGSRGNN